MYMEMQRNKNAYNKLEKELQNERVDLPEKKAYNKATVIKAVKNWCKHRQTHRLMEEKRV